MTGSIDKNTDVWQEQADAAISQANPVSTTLYTVLATTSNVKIKSIEAHVTWAVTQPTPLEVLVTVDGVVTTYIQADPVSPTPYYCRKAPAAAANAQVMTTDAAIAMNEANPLHEGRSILVQIRLTWAITQPSPLVCRVKYSKKLSS